MNSWLHVVSLFYVSANAGISTDSLIVCKYSGRIHPTNQFFGIKWWIHDHFMHEDIQDYNDLLEM